MWQVFVFVTELSLTKSSSTLFLFTTLIKTSVTNSIVQNIRVLTSSYNATVNKFSRGNKYSSTLRFDLKAATPCFIKLKIKYDAYKT